MFIHTIESNRYGGVFPFIWGGFPGLLHASCIGIGVSLEWFVLETSLYCVNFCVYIYTLSIDR
jgi:hypothetical protein